MRKYSTTYNYRRIFILVCYTGLLAIFSCSRIPVKNGEEPIVRVYDKYLYTNDMSGLFDNISDPADSARVARSFIDQWIKRQLMVRIAEMNVPEVQQDFEAMIDDYRSSLLIYEYEKQLLREKLDTLVTNSQLDSYYNENLHAFILDAPIVKALYIRIEKTNSNIPEIRRLIRSNRDQDFEQLITIGQRESDRFDFFNDEWVSFPLVMEKIPGNPDDADQFLGRNNIWESNDENFVHFLLIRDHLLTGEQAPIEFIRDKIRGLVLSNRKLDYVKQIEQDVLQDALKQQQIEIYE